MVPTRFTDGLLALCKVPAPSELHPLAADAITRWLVGFGTDIEMLWLASIIDSGNIDWAECLIRFAGSLGT